MNEQKLRQLFKNRANCYADAEDVIQAMDEDCFIQTINEILQLNQICSHPDKEFVSGVFGGYWCPKCNRNVDSELEQD